MLAVGARLGRVLLSGCEEYDAKSHGLSLHDRSQPAQPQLLQVGAVGAQLLPALHIRHCPQDEVRSFAQVGCQRTVQLLGACSLRLAEMLQLQLDSKLQQNLALPPGSNAGQKGITRGGRLGGRGGTGGW